MSGRKGGAGRGSVRFSPEELAFLKDGIRNYSFEELSGLLKERFETPRPAKSIKTACHQRGWKRNLPRPSPEELEFLRDNVRLHSFAGLAELLNEKFGRTLDWKQVANICHGRGWNNGFAGMVARRATDGSENTVTVHGKPAVRVKHGGKWTEKRRAVWERANGRPVPEGHAIVHADGDIGNFEPRNLLCLPNATGRAYANLSRGMRNRTEEAVEATVRLIETRQALAKLAKQTNGQGRG